MSYYAADGTCGSCEYYEYEGENVKGYCSFYRTYYYSNDSCRNWRKGNKAYSGGGCFLTTACCEYKGLGDDCYELQMMRTFRDTYLSQKIYGREIIKLYYEDAPGIIEAIEKSTAKETIYEEIYQKIKEIINMIEQKDYDEAVIHYMLMIYKLKQM